MTTEQQCRANSALIRIVEDIMKNKSFQTHKIDNFKKYISLMKIDEDFQQKVNEMNDYGFNFAEFLYKMDVYTSRQNVSTIIFQYDRQCVTLH